MKSDELFLHEEVLLLALHDEKGTTELGAMYPHAAAGAMLAELLLRDRIELHGDGKSEDKVVRVLNRAPTGAPLLDEILSEIAAEEKPSTMADWLMKIANRRDLKEKIVAKLCERGILRAEEDKFLLIFTRQIFPEVNPEPEDRLIARIREAVLTNRADLDPRTVILISLADQTGLLKGIFTRDELKSRRDRIDQLSSGQVMGSSVGEAIEEIQAMMATTAAFTASMAAVTAASASCSAATAAC